jgi:hypothetical protein
MSTATAILLLFLAAVLEAGGDAFIRLGLHSPTPLARAAWIAGGAILLLTYGYSVNSPPWDFGRVIGIYVVFFFLIAQAVSWLVFHQRPGLPILVGGGFIVTGGLILTVWNT